MWKKTALAVGALAVALIAFQPRAANAGDVNVGIGFGFGHSGWHHGGHGYNRGWPRHRLSCRQASRIVYRHGYHRVRARDCRGRFYGFIARKHHRLYMVKVNARNGRIVGRSRL